MAPSNPDATPRHATGCSKTHRAAARVRHGHPSASTWQQTIMYTCSVVTGRSTCT